MCSSGVGAADGIQLLVLLMCRDDGNATAGIAYQGCDLFPKQGGVNGHIGGANGECGEVGNGPLPAVFADEGDAVSLLSAPAQKGRSKGSNPLVNLV